MECPICGKEVAGILMLANHLAISHNRIKNNILMCWCGQCFGDERRSAPSGEKPDMLCTCGDCQIIAQAFADHLTSVGDIKQHIALHALARGV